jgi:hypothetical protein
MMGKNSSRGGGARAGRGRSESSEASSVSADVAGYADLVTPNGMKIHPNGKIEMRKPRSAEQAASYLRVLAKANDIATHEVKLASTLPANHRAKVAANLRALHVSKQLDRAIKWARAFT